MIQASVVVALVLSRAAIRDTMGRDEAASMIGYVTMAMAVVPMLTPAIGGYLDQHFSWKATFWVYFAAGVATFALIWSDMGETNLEPATSFRRQLFR